jgi:hypothetical protein
MVLFEKQPFVVVVVVGFRVKELRSVTLLEIYFVELSVINKTGLTSSIHNIHIQSKFYKSGIIYPQSLSLLGFESVLESSHILSSLLPTSISSASSLISLVFLSYKSSCTLILSIQLWMYSLLLLIRWSLLALEYFWATSNNSG